MTEKAEQLRAKIERLLKDHENSLQKLQSIIKDLEGMKEINLDNARNVLEQILTNGKELRQNLLAAISMVNTPDQQLPDISDLEQLKSIVEDILCKLREMIEDLPLQRVNRLLQELCNGTCEGDKQVFNTKLQNKAVDEIKSRLAKYPNEISIFPGPDEMGSSWLDWFWSMEAAIRNEMVNSLHDNEWSNLAIFLNAVEKENWVSTPEQLYEESIEPEAVEVKVEIQPDIKQEIVKEMEISTPSVEAPEETIVVPLENPVIEQAAELSPVGVVDPITETPSSKVNDSDIQNDTGPNPEELWKILLRGDEAGAYWFARSLEILGISSPVPSSILAVLAVSRWMDPNSGRFAGDIGDVVSSQIWDQTNHRELLALAAALVPTLTAPETKLRGWLFDNQSHPIRNVVEAIANLANLGHVLKPELLGSVNDISVAKQQRKEAERSFAKWEHENKNRTIKFQPATAVWQDLAMRTFLPVINEIIKGNTSNEVVKTAQQLIENLNSKNAKDQEINRIDKRLRGNKPPIEAGARLKLELFIEETCQEIRKWIGLVRREQQLESHNWSVNQVGDLVSKVRDGLPAIARWAEDKVISGDVSSAACAIAFKRSMFLLAQVLNIDSAEQESDIPPGLERLARQQSDMQVALRQRLLWCEEISWYQEDLSTATALKLTQRLTKEIPSAEAMFTTWIELKAFDHADVQKDLVDPLHVKKFDEALGPARRDLIDQVERALDDVEQGMVDGFIGDERPEMIERLNRIDARQTYRIRHGLEVVAQVQSEIDRMRRERLDRGLADWENDLKSKIIGIVTPDDFIKIENRILEPFKEKDVRVLEERISTIRTELATEGAPRLTNLEERPEKSRRSKVREFQEFQKMVSDTQKPEFRLANIQHLLESKQQPFPSFPSLRVIEGQKRKKVYDALTAWKKTKDISSGKVTNDFLDNIRTIFEFFGFSYLGFGRSKVEKNYVGWIHLSLPLTDGEACWIPAFGSQSRGNYNVLCVWEQPGPDVLSRILTDPSFSGKPVFILYFGRLGEQRRINIRTMAGQKNVPHLLVDEVLFLFLMTQGDQRMNALFDCALPYSQLNPYTPFRAGDVPSEMFYGRTDLVSYLLNPEGGCIVYGGRQLGKSALLREVQRRFDVPSHRRAVVVDIRAIGDPATGQDTVQLWFVIRRRLEEEKVIDFGKKSKPEQIIDAIREHLIRNPESRLLLLLDEADHLLDADSKENFRQVDSLRSLMADTGRRFKVVLAGLHNVQRFQQLPNQPLAHFGHAVQVGPLEPQAALELVKRPFEMLGYTFNSDVEILRILSYTNYHPGLIQLFCHNLLNTLQKSNPSSPPYLVTRDKVDAVYRQQEVRDGIRDRFNWTLALDMRYQAIVWSMVVDGTDGVGTGWYTSSQLKDLASGWWARGFSEIAEDEFHGILNEMCGLGVLIGSMDQSYRLRSPNLVHLLGDVERKLLELATKEPPTVFKADRIRRYVGDDLFSPLTLGQERQLFDMHWGVVFVFGSEALGISKLKEALKAVHDGNSMIDVVTPHLPRQPGDLSELVKKETTLGKQQGGLKIILFDAPTDAVKLNALVRTTQQACQHRKASSVNSFGRIVFVLNPEATWSWLNLAEVRKVEESLVCLPIYKWFRHGLRERMKQKELLYSDEDVNVLHDNTSGWASLVDKVFTAAQKPGEAAQECHRRCLNELKKELAEKNNQISDQFLSSTGVRVHERILEFLRLLNLVTENERLPLSQLDPNLFSKEMGGLEVQEFETIIEYLVRMGVIERRYVGSEANGVTSGEMIIWVDPLVSRLLTN